MSVRTRANIESAVVGDLLTSEKQARSIKYQMTIAKLPLAKDLEDFDFTNTGINETLVNDLAGGDFLAHERNVVLIGGTGTGHRRRYPAALSILSSADPGRGYSGTLDPPTYALWEHNDDVKATLDQPLTVSDERFYPMIRAMIASTFSVWAISSRTVFL